MRQTFIWLDGALGAARPTYSGIALSYAKVVERKLALAFRLGCSRIPGPASKARLSLLYVPSALANLQYFGGFDYQSGR